MLASNFLDPAYKKLSPQEYKKFQILCAVFQEKNSQINLSALRDEHSIWEKHFYDSLLGAEFVAAGEKILDLGSGGGFPASPLAIVFPEKHFLCVDSVTKKMKAVQEIVVQSGISNVSTLAARAEEVGHNKVYRAQYDLVTARAFAAFSVCLELALPLVKEKGSVLLYRGPESDEDDELLAEAFGGFVRTRKKATLPNGDLREIWEIVKIAPTEKRFPRGNGIPKKQPMTLQIMNNFQ